MAAPPLIIIECPRDGLDHPIYIHKNAGVSESIAVTCEDAMTFESSKEALKHLAKNYGVRNLDTSGYQLHYQAAVLALEDQEMAEYIRQMRG